MESPAKSIRFIHKAIQTEIDALDKAVDRLAASESDDTAELARRFDFFYRVVKAHEDGEEDTFFPALDLRVYPASAPYLLDHQVDQRHIREVIQSFGRPVENPNGAARGETLRQMSRLTIMIDAATSMHIQKEEEILVPLVEQHFSVEEQEDIARRAIGHFPPDLMQQALPWMVLSLPPDDQAAFLRMLMHTVPPDAFPAMSGLLSTSLPPNQWAEIVRRLPEAA
jgi:iron-sulfur cluster repair protein YtfE (RIC family)